MQTNSTVQQVLLTCSCTSSFFHANVIQSYTVIACVLSLIKLSRKCHLKRRATHKCQLRKFPRRRSSQGFPTPLRLLANLHTSAVVSLLYITTGNKTLLEQNTTGNKTSIYYWVRVIKNKKVQQSWQTSALAMLLHLARSVSMPVIFCLLPSSSIVILVFHLFSTGISEQHAWELWVWMQSESTGFSGLTLPLRVTPMNNPITLLSPVQSLGYSFVALTVICVALRISE